MLQRRFRAYPNIGVAVNLFVKLESMIEIIVCKSKNGIHLHREI